MHSRTRLTPLLCAAVLAACAQSAPAPTPGAACRAEGALFAVGQPLTDALAQDAARRAGASRVRLLRPGQVVTLEFDGGRLNLDVDASSKVTGARCG